MGGDITGGFFQGAGFPSCHKSIYRVSEDNFRGSACVSEWMLSVKIRWGVGLS
jgi:sugar phosphate permease